MLWSYRCTHRHSTIVLHCCPAPTLQGDVLPRWQDLPQQVANYPSCYVFHVEVTHICAWQRLANTNDVRTSYAWLFWSRWFVLHRAYPDMSAITLLANDAVHMPMTPNVDMTVKDRNVEKAKLQSHMLVMLFK